MTTAIALPDTMTVGDLHLAVRASPHRATVGLTVDRDGSLYLHAPPGYDPETLAAWAHSKRMWIYRKLAEKDLWASARPTKQFVTGEGFCYLGRSHRLLVTDTDTVRMHRGRFHIPRDQATTDPATALIGWYRERGRQWLPARLRPWRNAWASPRPGWRYATSATGGAPSPAKAASTSTGPPCNSARPSSTTSSSANSPTHLNHPRHTPAFWATVKRALPDYERRKNDLLTAGAHLWLG